jgi:hypothetical protein
VLSADADDVAFGDSRGTRKRTDDNLRIFTEDELGLTKNLTGGGECVFELPRAASREVEEERHGRIGRG